jgi:DNA-directed RNA polymerase specialized sigma24 family protein
MCVFDWPISGPPSVRWNLEPRELIAMRYALDLSVADMAAFTGKSPNAVSVALHRALTTLRHIMEGDPT